MVLMLKSVISDRPKLSNGKNIPGTYNDNHNDNNNYYYNNNDGNTIFHCPPQQLHKASDV